MKKLLVLVAMLGLVVGANALTLTDNVNPRYDFNFDGTFLSLKVLDGAAAFASGGNGSYALFYTGAGSISNQGAIGYNANIDLDPESEFYNPFGDFSFNVDPEATLATIGLGTGIIVNMTAFAGPAPTGVNLVWNIGVAPAANATISFIKLNSTMTAVSGSELYKGTFVPEPITVALLGLGGLFIRRRKVA